MKNLFLLLIVGFFSFSFLNLDAQNKKDTIWYDDNWNVAEKKIAAYYRPFPIEKDGGYWLQDYYMSGTKQMEAWSNKPDSEFFNGKVTWFYENGNVLQTVHYKKNVLDGERKYYYESGSLKSEYSYKNGKVEGAYINYHENKKKNEVGQYKNDLRNGIWKEYYTNGQLKAEGKYKKGKKVGEWKVYYYDGLPENDQLLVNN